MSAMFRTPGDLVLHVVGPAAGAVWGRPKGVILPINFVVAALPILLLELAAAVFAGETGTVTAATSRRRPSWW